VYLHRKATASARLSIMQAQSLSAPAVVRILV